MDIEEITEKWQDALDCAEPTDYEARNLIEEFLDDLKHVKGAV